MNNEIKDLVQYGCAVAMIACGIGLSIASFAVLHEVHSTVLALVGEAIGFAGAVFGISLYARTKFRDLEQRFAELEFNQSHSTEKEDNEKN